MRRAELFSSLVPPRSAPRAECAVSADASRCLRMRFNRNTCSDCADACEAKALRVEGGLALERAQCTNCMVCVSVCPTGAFTPKGPDWRTKASRLEDPAAPVLGCSTAPAAAANERIPCLGMLSEEHLIHLFVSLEGPLQLNLSACGDCVNSFVPGLLRERLMRAAGNISADMRDRIRLVEKAADLEFRERTCGRRGFFSDLRRTATHMVAEFIEDQSRADEPGAYLDKRLPLRRRLLNAALPRMAEEMRQKAMAGYYFTVVAENRPLGATALAALCPTGALKAGEKGAALEFRAGLCSGCGLCENFSASGGIRVRKGAAAKGFDSWTAVETSSSSKELRPLTPKGAA